MIMPNPTPKDEAGCDELDRLVRKALRALVSKQAPPERTWKQIKVQLERGGSPSRRFQIPKLPLVIQPALTLLLLVLGGVALWVVSNPYDARNFSSPRLSSPVSTISIEESAALALAMLQDKEELRLLKSYSKPSSAYAQQTVVDPAERPPLVIPRDPIPNVWSPEGRAFLAELSLRRLAAEDRQHEHSGPYQWHR
jgi:hypothetical protein